MVEEVDDKFIESIKYLIENSDERKRLGINAYKLAKEKYDWQKLGEELYILYRNNLGWKSMKNSPTFNEFDSKCINNDIQGLVKYANK